MTKYRIDVWIPAEVENPQIYDTQDEAEDDLLSLSAMQPENVYEVVETFEIGDHVEITDPGPDNDKWLKKGQTGVINEISKVDANVVKIIFDKLMTGEQDDQSVWWVSGATLKKHCLLCIQN